MADVPFDYRDVGKRLRQMRLALGMPSQLSFARSVGISHSRWNVYEAGQPLPQWIAILLVQRFPGLSMDWLYFGREDTLQEPFKGTLSRFLRGLERISVTLSDKRA